MCFEWLKSDFSFVSLRDQLMMAHLIVKSSGFGLLTVINILTELPFDSMGYSCLCAMFGTQSPFSICAMAFAKLSKLCMIYQAAGLFKPPQFHEHTF